MADRPAPKSATSLSGRGPSGLRIAERMAAEIEALMSAPLTPALYLVATPIGNLADISPRALAILAKADRVYCEDTRHSQKLLSHYAVSRKPAAYHEHNAERMRPQILAALAENRSIALMSDAGTPLVSDPGFKLARAALDQGSRVIAIPGPSAALVALTVSGLPSDRFLFAGFLPPRSAARRARLQELKDVAATLVFFEAPSRLPAMLADLNVVLGDRAAAVARELTKLYEQVERGSLSRLSAWAATAELRGELAVIVAPPLPNEITDEAILDRLEPALKTMSVRDAARSVAEALGVGKTRVYDLAVVVRRGLSE